MKLLAQGKVEDIFGKITPPPGPRALNEGDIGRNVTALFAFAINGVFVLGGIIVLLYFIWGSIDWVMSGGEKENLEKARKKIRNAFVGLIVLISAFVIWIFITSTFGLIDASTPGQIRFKLPGFENN
ncbi:hypothetical protein A3H80_01980 [Candidatus Roizmanbacteria bacterium RIFCSPLOWO2_02_FULL_37_19]|nr:MAG: hypothetical protein A2862_02565 [Candidatus Roizmanbacteria bacterium RIFCSPHIGHO2_01_FULL_38_41]OGK32291.1 MAG: hypothetical protein A3E10_04775 [Candidatus Roizmanbacteria bacterium RIFCSPHIGHO2_12_FULL_37_23]OGK43587.1 MAG: hypothetical protein A2956_02165 [Candidatus Roizmanbacteria bacterium RIFCSPLOWO2_01_FULL_37_57]OGK54313.1 MAG: hypothetical protein A3H80_01980 [Candidatus Roizmanbacteria bacterium RIFCSPLOWO2_02_FULL_37_19]OGK61872.1 MAG: hypothetical protein A3G65_02670 [Can